MSASRHSASAKVVAVGRFGSRPWERGKSSYHAPNRARSRSTTSEQLRRSRGEAPIGVTAHGRQHLVGVERRDAACRRSGAAQGGQRGAEDAQVVGRLRALGAGEGVLDEEPPLLDLRRDRHAGLDLLVQPLPPAAVGVAPGLDRVPVPPVAGELDVARPSVVLDRPHRRLVPGLLVVGTHEERGVEQVVAVGDDVGRDEQLIADDALDRVSAAVELGGDPLDHDARAACRPRRLRARARRSRPAPRAAHSPSSSSWLWRNPTRSATMHPMKAVHACRSALLLALVLAACATPSPSAAPSGASGPPRRRAAPEPTNDAERIGSAFRRADRRGPAAAGAGGGRDGPGRPDQHHRHTRTAGCS